MTTIFTNAKRNAQHTFSQLRSFLSPSRQTLSRINLCIFAIFFLLILIATLLYAPYMGFLPTLITLLVLTTISLVAALAGIALLRWLGRIPFWTGAALLFGIPVLMMHFHVHIISTLILHSFLILTAIMLAVSLYIITRLWHTSGRTKRILTIICLVAALSHLMAGTWWFLHPGKTMEMPLNAALQSPTLPDILSLDDPSQPGSFPVQYLTYGSGQDKHRPEYGAEAVLETPSVDGSSFLEDWSGFTGKLRSRYFGFDPTALPLNGRVWYPGGDGPFPLVLIVHGNHLAQDFSDPGYAYLGELLASRGFITVSVDQNFLNGSFTNLFKGMGNENDARGWLLLKHLQQWQQWNDTTDNPFYGKVDMDKLALIGHSRGGEAVAHAALFNNLPFYPDNALETFDFGFNLGAIIAIAPSDGQYQPASSRTPLQDINYLVLQGSHDSDLTSYQGMRQFHRIDFSPGTDHIKAGVYIYNANHGQFNSRWGNKDNSHPRINFFNLAQLMPQEDQQQIAKVYISAFLEHCLNQQTGYRPLFVDARKGRHWLPETIYLSQYEQAQTQWIGTFGEDMDLSTTTLPGGTIEAQDLSIWREQTLFLNWGDYGSRMLVLGWNTTDNDTLQPAWHMHLPPGSISMPAKAMLVFAMTETGETASPPSSDKGNNENANGNRSDGNNTALNNQPDEPPYIRNDEEETPQPIDFSIELEDGGGQIVWFALSQCKPLQPLLNRQLTKLGFTQTAGRNESVIDHFWFPLSLLTENGSPFDTDNIVRISFVFDGSQQGVIAINNIGIMDAAVLQGD